MKRIFLLLIIASLISSSFLACNNNRPARLIQFRGTVFGTIYSISYYDVKGRMLQTEIEELLNSFNNSLSTYEHNSIISRVNRNETQEGDAFFNTVFKKALEVSAITEGAFDPTVAPLVNAWGFGFTEKPELSKKLIDSIADFVGYQKIHFKNNLVVKDDPRIMLDFNAIAKGYAVDVVASYLDDQDISSYLVEIGGEVVAGDAKPNGDKWRVGIERPADSADAEQQWEVIVELERKAIATSGTYRKFYEEKGVKYSHTIDPKTCAPVNHSLLSATVIAKDCMTADAFATGFMVWGVEKSISFVENNPEMEAFFIYDDGNGNFLTYKTPGLNVKTRDDL